jgi:hypothetical protein
MQRTAGASAARQPPSHRAAVQLTKAPARHFDRPLPRLGRPPMVALAARYALPAIYPVREFAEPFSLRPAADQRSKNSCV